MNKERMEKIIKDLDGPSVHLLFYDNDIDPLVIEKSEAIFQEYKDQFQEEGISLYHCLLIENGLGVRRLKRFLRHMKHRIVSSRRLSRISAGRKIVFHEIIYV